MQGALWTWPALRGAVRWQLEMLPAMGSEASLSPGVVTIGPTRAEACSHSERIPSLPGRSREGCRPFLPEGTGRNKPLSKLNPEQAKSPE